MYIYNNKRIINSDRFDYLYVDENAVFARRDDKDITIRSFESHEEAEKFLEQLYVEMMLQGGQMIDVYGKWAAPGISD